jgi:1,4-dihydroxy-2-naphthoate polyprenyltransferase
VGTIDMPIDASLAATPRFATRLRAYARMGRTIRYENWLGTPLWWSLLPSTTTATEARTLVLVPLTLLMYGAMVAVMGTLDDVQGYRDGSDLANYRRSDPTGLRPITRKPLLLGWVTEGQALRYALAAGTVCAATTVAAWQLGTAEPPWWLAAWVAVAFVGTQYSAGLRLSYVGAQELTLLTVKVGSVVVPYTLVTGHLPARTAVAAMALALWFVEVSMCSNTHDIDGDRSAGRRTLAVLLGEAAHRRVIAAVVGVDWTVALAATLAGWWSPWLLAAVAPAAALHARQLRALFRGDPLAARALGFLALRVGVLGLCLAAVATR